MLRQTAIPIDTKLARPVLVVWNEWVGEGHSALRLVHVLVWSIRCLPEVVDKTA